jgi:hypothetical protein
MSAGMIWDEAVDKKVKSSDDKDLGKIQKVTKEYIQVNEGLVSKKSYFIPKYYVQGYDGNYLWVSLTKDGTKQTFERESPPDNVSEFETPSYLERKASVAKQYPDFENNIPTYTRSMPQSAATTSQADTLKIPWEKLIDRKIKSTDNKDLGKIKQVASLYVEADEGHISKKRYFIPKFYVDSFDGDYLHTSLTKEEIKSRYERDNPPSDAELRTQEDLEQKKKATIENPQQQLLHGVPFVATESGVTIRNEATGEESKIEWAEVIHKHVRTTIDDVDIGDVEKVGDNFIVVRKGVAKVHLYYIPKAYISNYDGSSFYINTDSNDLRKFERETEPTAEQIQALVKEAPGSQMGAPEEKRERNTTISGNEEEEGAAGSQHKDKDDPLTSYRGKEPMTPAKIKEHEPTAVKREMTEKIIEPGQKTGTNSEEALGKARSKGMTKGIDDSSEIKEENE